MIVAGLAVGALGVAAFALLAPRPPAVALAAVPVAQLERWADAVSGDYATYADPAWLARTSQATGIPERVLAAYAGTSIALQSEHPACNLGWTTLAAIGAVESGHGTHDGSVVGEDGKATPPILGPVLDGGDFGEVEDTDGGELDGDPEWDRALGPMQFLPGIWAAYAATDGDLDGVGDPQDVDDAVLAAGRYLCLAVEADTADPETWRAAVGSYNHSDAYVDLVAQTANEYAAAAPDATPPDETR